jgi:hypothetical protein
MRNVIRYKDYRIDPTPQGRWEVVTKVRDILIGGWAEDVLGVFATLEEAQAFVAEMQNEIE